MSKLNHPPKPNFKNTTHKFLKSRSFFLAICALVIAASGVGTYLWKYQQPVVITSSPITTTPKDTLPPNAKYIKDMSDEELATYIIGIEKVHTDPQGLIRTMIQNARSKKYSQGYNEWYLLTEGDGPMTSLGNINSEVDTSIAAYALVGVSSSTSSYYRYQFDAKNWVFIGYLGQTFSCDLAIKGIPRSVEAYCATDKLDPSSYVANPLIEE